MRPISIAIDGPAGAGKSTVARELARRLGIWYVDTGAMYRGVAWLVVRHGISLADETEILHLLDAHPLRFVQNDSGTLHVYVDGEDITGELRSPEVSEYVSQISVYLGVRQKLTKWQRDFSTRASVVMDGRDIGTVVLPNADVKVFLTAELTERTKRRAEEFSQKGFLVSVENLQAAIMERDERDASRDVAPLKPAADAFCIDSTGRSVREVVDEILAIVEQVAYD